MRRLSFSAIAGLLVAVGSVFTGCGAPVAGNTTGTADSAMSTMDKMGGEKMSGDAMSDNKMTDNKMTDNKMSDGKMSDGKMADGKMASN